MTEYYLRFLFARRIIKSFLGKTRGQGLSFAR